MYVSQKTGKRLRVPFSILRALMLTVAMAMVLLIFTAFVMDGNVEYKNDVNGSAGVSDGRQPETEPFFEAASESPRNRTLSAETFYTGPGLVI